MQVTVNIDENEFVGCILRGLVKNGWMSGIYNGISFANTENKEDADALENILKGMNLEGKYKRTDYYHEEHEKQTLWKIEFVEVL